MKIEQRTFKGSPDAEALAKMAVIRPELVLAFASVDRIADPALHVRLRAAFGGAALMGCSTAGEISAHSVDDNSVVVTALAFDSPGFRVVSTTFEAAAESAPAPDGDASPSLALLVSCVGRKLVMGARVEEEVEAVADVLGHASVVTGFYSNGEISPQLPSAGCRLHNQTMTITTLRELPAA